MEPKKTPTQKHFCHILNFQDLHVHIDQGFGFTSMLSECTGKRLGTKTPQLLILLTLAIRPKLYCEVSPPMPTMQENGLEIEKKCAKKNKLSLDTLKAAFIFSTWMWMWVKKAHWKLPGLFLFQVIRCSRVGEWPKSPKDSLKSVSTPFFWEATNLQEFRRSFQPLTFHFPIKPAATPYKIQCWTKCWKCALFWLCTQGWLKGPDVEPYGCDMLVTHGTVESLHAPSAVASCCFSWRQTVPSVEH